MRKLIVVFTMILLLLVLANCAKNGQTQEEVTPKTIPVYPHELEIYGLSDTTTTQRVTPVEVTPVEAIPVELQDIYPVENQETLKELDNEEGKEYSIPEANNNLSLALFKLIDKDGKNLVFSSFSISNALAMAAETTEEEVSNSIRRVLRLPKDITSVREGYQSILNNYKKEKKDYQLNIANALWVDNKYSIETLKQENVEKFYLGETLAFDNSEPQFTAMQVNKWCDNQTKGMIKQIITPGDIKPLTHLILTNAIYFKGTWQNEFKESNTKDKVFYNSMGVKSEVKFMEKEEKFAYAENDIAQVLKMSYKGDDLSMLIILPRENDVKSLSDSLTPEMLAQWNQELETYKVNVSLPKFKFDFGANMNEPLKELGMARAFTSKSVNELYIDKVLHKAIIDVNEEGTEAAAVTVVAMTTRSASPQYEMRTFNADHPFLFVIQDDRNQNILFMGKVEEPEYKPK